jgi:hypothetical protein
MAWAAAASDARRRLAAGDAEAALASLAALRYAIIPIPVLIIPIVIVIVVEGWPSPHVGPR